MAASSSSFLTVTKPSSFNRSAPNLSPLLKNTLSLSSFHRSPGWHKNGLRINAVAQKWEPTKVVPQADKSVDSPGRVASGVHLYCLLTIELSFIWFA